VIARRQSRRLAPILAGLTPTDQRFTNSDLRAAMADSMSMKRVVLLGAFLTFSALFNVAALIYHYVRHTLFSDFQSYVVLLFAIVLGSLAISFFSVARLKARRTPDA
jgi:hypothetical protein